MLELEHAAARWKQQVDTADLLHHPTFTVAHYSDTTLLGSASHPGVTSEPDLILLLGTPFAVCSDVSDMFVFLDRPGHVLITHLYTEGRGVHTVDSRLPYLFDGTITFATPVEEWHPVEAVRTVCDQLAGSRCRGTQPLPFKDVFTAALKWGELHETYRS